VGSCVLFLRILHYNAELTTQEIRSDLDLGNRLPRKVHGEKKIVQWHRIECKPHIRSIVYYFYRKST